MNMYQNMSVKCVAIFENVQTLLLLWIWVHLVSHFVVIARLRLVIVYFSPERLEYNSKALSQLCVGCGSCT